MHSLAAAYAAGAQDALLKFAATRAHKEIWKSMRGGDMARANRLATMPGLLTDSPRAQQLGHQLKDLGRGNEGLATAVAHPTHGASARKIYDPAAPVYSPTIVKRKEQLGDRVEGAAKYLGSSQTQHGTPIHFNEYVPGQAIKPSMMRDPEFAQKFEQAKARTQISGRAQGRELHDLRPANAMRTPEGDVKFVDTMPFNRDEVHHPLAEKHLRATRQISPNHMPLIEKGIGLFPNETVNRSSTTPQFKRYMLGNKGNPSDFKSQRVIAPSSTTVPAPLGPHGPWVPHDWHAPRAPPTPPAPPPNVTPAQNSMVDAKTAPPAPTQLTAPPTQLTAPPTQLTAPPTQLTAPPTTVNPPRRGP